MIIRKGRKRLHLRLYNNLWEQKDKTKQERMSGGGGGEEEATLEFTPTWVVAAVCTVIVAISLAAERLLHYGGKFLKAKDQKSLYEALQKIKEGFFFFLSLH